MFKRGALLISILALFLISYSVDATDDCPDFRLPHIADDSPRMCMGGEFPPCSNANANNPVCRQPEYTCEDLGIFDIMDGDFSCVRCNSEDNYIGLVGRERGCTLCENGEINENQGEECESNDLNGETCESLGYEGGSLICSNNCRFDTSRCDLCGNNQVDQSEVCDGSDLNGETCQSKGYEGGSLSCSNNCDGYITNNCVESLPAGTVFTTSELYPGNLEGLSGADQKCQEAADSVNADNVAEDSFDIIQEGGGLGGTWIALLDYTLRPGEGRLLSNAAATRIPWSFNGPIKRIDGEVVSDGLGVIEMEDGDRRSMYSLFFNGDMYNIEDPYVDLSIDQYGNQIEGRPVWVGFVGSGIDCVNYVIENNEDHRRSSSETPDDWATSYCSYRGIDPGRWTPILSTDNVIGEVIGWSSNENNQACVGYSNDETMLTDYAREACTYSASLYCMKLPKEIKITTSGGEDNICEKDSERYMVEIKNTGADLENVRIFDMIKKDNRIVWPRIFNCGNMRRGDICHNEFNYQFMTDGSYYRQIIIIADNEVITKVINNEDVVITDYQGIITVGMENTVVLDESVGECCTPETSYRRNNDYRACCDGMPEDYNPELAGAGGRGLRGAGNACGCPSGLDWDIDDRACIPRAGEICYDLNIETGEVDEDLLCWYEWFTQPWWAQALDQEDNCFAIYEVQDHPNNPKRACCYYRDYEGHRYGEYQDVEIY
jgi:hypothetical protein